jgi:hypothetical protein
MERGNENEEVLILTYIACHIDTLTRNKSGVVVIRAILRSPFRTMTQVDRIPQSGVADEQTCRTPQLNSVNKVSEFQLLRCPITIDQRCKIKPFEIIFFSIELRRL